MHKMLEALNKQLIEIKEKTRKRQKLLADLARTEQMLAQQRSRLQGLDAQLKKEGSDVEKLQGLSLTGLFHTILGSKDKQLEKERQEYLAAKLKHDECRDSVSALEREQADLKEKIAALGNPESQYKSILDKKEKVIAETGDQSARRLIDLAEVLADARSDVRELQEAIDAGKAVLTGVEAVIDSLKSAKNWGTWDMIGGGLISTAVKHSRIDRARASAHQVQQLLRRFQRELADVGGTSDITIDIGSFATFADQDKN
jgi:DNA repair exonuclease SbcCD ATPase subunit